MTLRIIGEGRQSMILHYISVLTIVACKKGWGSEGRGWGGSVLFAMHPVMECSWTLSIFSPITGQEDRKSLREWTDGEMRPEFWWCAKKTTKRGRCVVGGHGSVLVCWPLCTSTGLKFLNTFPELISVLKLIPLPHFPMPSVSNFTKSSISASPLSSLPTSPPPHSSFVLHLA